MHPLLAPIVYGLPGVLIGYCIGRWNRAEVKREIEHELAHDQGREPDVTRKPWPWQRLIGAFLIVLAITSGVLVSTQVSRYGDSLDLIRQVATVADDRAACVTDVLTAFTEAANETAELTAQTSAAARAQATAQASESAAGAAALAAILSPDDLSDDQIRTIFQTYLDASTAAGDAAAHYVEVSQQLSDARREHPVPDKSAIDACR